MEIVSGGQTGVDQIALEAAVQFVEINEKYLNRLKTSGWAPNGYMTSNGPNRRLKTRYNLKEIISSSSLSSQYVARSKKNVDDSDATLAFILYKSTGTARTVGYATTGAWKSIELPGDTEGYVDLTYLHNTSSTNETQSFNLSQGGEVEINPGPLTPEPFLVVPYRPCFVILSLSPILKEKQLSALLSFIRRHGVSRLNICGHRLNAKLQPHLLALVDLMIDLIEAIVLCS